eukprot:6471064-Amphidinium_carterae.1
MVAFMGVLRVSSILHAIQVLPVRRGIGMKSVGSMTSWEKMLTREAEGALVTSAVRGGKAKNTAAMAAFQAQCGVPYPKLMANVQWLETLDKMLLRSFGWGLAVHMRTTTETSIGGRQVL